YCRYDLLSEGVAVSEGVVGGYVCISCPRNSCVRQRVSIADLSAVAGLLEHLGLRNLQPFGQLFGRQKVDGLNAGDLSGRNLVEGVILPEAATKPKPTVAATREE